MGRKFGIIGVQMFVQGGDVRANLESMKRYIKFCTAAYPFAEMLVFSEFALYGAPYPAWKKDAESIPGPLTEELCSIAKKYKRWLVPGTIYEREGDAIYNTAVVISPEGELVTTYRKLFPWQPLEETTPGQDFCVFDVPAVGRFGLCICYDMWFPEVCRTLAWMGAEVILHPTMTTSADREQELVLARANAIFNQCYFIDVNGVGWGGVGQSRFVDPHGRVLQSAGNETVMMVEILDLENVKTAREFGTANVSQHLKQLKAFPHTFPPYEKGIANGEGFKDLGPVAVQKKL